MLFRSIPTNGRNLLFPESTRSPHVVSGLPHLPTRTQTKNGPISGASFKEAKVVGDLGKAMQVTVPPAGSALRELMRRIEESEGHVAEFAASLLPLEEALAAPKQK